MKTKKIVEKCSFLPKLLDKIIRKQTNFLS